MKKIKAMLKIMLFIIISLIVLILPDLSTYPTGFGKCETTSYSAFKNESRIQYLWDELPEGASFYKGYTQNKLMYAYGLYSFWVEPDQLQGIVDATVAKYHIDVEKAKDKENTEEYRPELWYMMKVQDAFDKHNEGIYRFPYFYHSIKSYMMILATMILFIIALRDRDLPHMAML